MMDEILTLVALALALLFAEFRGACRARDRGEEAGRQGLNLQSCPHLERHYVDLRAVPGDRIPDGISHLLRRDLPDHRAGLEPGLRPHPGIADEGRADH